MSKPFRKLLYVLGALALLAAVFVGVLSTPWAQRAIERRIITSLESLTGGQIQVRAFRFNPVLLQATFHGLVLRGRESASDPPLFSAQTMVVQLHPTSLLRRQLLLHSLDWDSAAIHVTSRSDGTTNLPEPLAALLPEIDSADVQIERLALARTEFYWNQQQFLLDLHAQNVAFLLRHKNARNYSGSLSTSEIKVKTHGRELPAISLATQFDLSARELQMTSLTWQAGGLRGIGALKVLNWANPEGTLALEASGEIAELARGLGLPEVRGGHIESKAHVTFQGKDWRAQGQTQIRQVLIQTPAFRMSAFDFATDFSADSDRILMPNFSASALGGAEAGRAEIAFQSPGPKFSIGARLRNLALESVLGTLSIASSTLSRGYAAQIGGTLEAAWRGRFDDFSSHFDLQLQPGGRADSVPLSGSVSGAATLGRGLVLQIQDAEVRTPHSTLSTQGTLGAHEARLAVQLVTSNLADLSPAIRFFSGTTEPIPLKLNSQATFAGEISGEPGRPEIRARLEAGGFEFRNSAWDRAEAEIVAGAGLVEIRSGRLARGKSMLAVAATVPLDAWKAAPSKPLHISANAQRTPLDGLKGALNVDYPVEGLVTGRLDLGGTLSSLSGKGEIRVEQGTLAGEPFDSFSTRLRVEDSTWHFNDLLLAKGPGRASGSASLNPVSRAFAAELNGAGFSLASIKLLVPSRQGQHPLNLEGSIGFNLRGEGTLDNANLQGSWSCRKITMDETAFGDLEGPVNWQGREIQLKGESKGPAGEVSFSGTARAEGDWPLELSGAYSNLRVEPWLRAFVGKKFNARVTTNGTLSARGPLKDASRIEVRAQSRSLEVSFPSLTWKNDQAVEFRYANRKLTVDRFRVSGPSTDLEVEGSVQFGASAALAFVAEGRTDATILSLFDPGLQASGRSEIKLRVSGSPEHPLFNGTMNVQDVSLSYSDFPFHVTGLAGEVSLDGDRANVRSLRGTSGGGSVVLSGFVTFADPPRFNLQAALNQVRVRYPIDLTSVLEGDLNLTGSTERAQIAGELVIRQMSPGENFNWLVRLGQAAGGPGVKPPALASPFSPRVRLNIQVNSAPAVRFETHDLRLLGEIDLRLQGTLAHPVEVGSVQIISGEVVLRGNRYKLDHGYINLTNPYRTQPIFDIEARTRVQRYDLTVNASGPPERIKITYRSDPPLPSTDIVSLLAFGYASQEEDMATRTNQPVQTVGASALLSQALSTQVSGRIQRLFGVSRIKIDPNLGGLGYTAGGARVTVEQQMTRDLTLTYVTTTSTSQQRIIQFEWNVSDNVSLLGVRDQNGILGMELKFRQRFK